MIAHFIGGPFDKQVREISSRHYPYRVPVVREIEVFEPEIAMSSASQYVEYYPHEFDSRGELFIVYALSKSRKEVLRQIFESYWSEDAKSVIRK